MNSALKLLGIGAGLACVGGIVWYVFGTKRNSEPNWRNGHKDDPNAPLEFPEQMTPVSGREFSKGRASAALRAVACVNDSEYELKGYCCLKIHCELDGRYAADARVELTHIRTPGGVTSFESGFSIRPIFERERMLEMGHAVKMVIEDFIRELNSLRDRQIAESVRNSLRQSAN